MANPGDTVPSVKLEHSDVSPRAHAGHTGSMPLGRHESTGSTSTLVPTFIGIGAGSPVPEPARDLVAKFGSERAPGPPPGPAPGLVPEPGSDPAPAPASALAPAPAPAPDSASAAFAPISATTPTFSWPSVNGKDENGDVEGESCSSTRFLSLPQKPAWVVRIFTHSSLGRAGGSTSRSCMLEKRS